MEEGTEKPRLYHCPEWHAVRRDIPEAFRKWEQKAKTSTRTLSVNANDFSVTEW